CRSTAEASCRSCATGSAKDTSGLLGTFSATAPCDKEDGNSIGACLDGSGNCTTWTPTAPRHTIWPPNSLIGRRRWPSCGKLGLAAPKSISTSNDLNENLLH